MLNYTDVMTSDRNPVEGLRRAQNEWESERESIEAAKIEADAKRQSAVIAALDAGASAGEIAKAMGLSTARIYQIRDGRR